MTIRFSATTSTRRTALAGAVLAGLLVIASISVDAGAVTGRAARGATPKCWGAASGDPQHPCDNHQLDDKVVPTPAQALLIPDGYCWNVRVDSGLGVCNFGAHVASGKPSVALIGDSHAQQWRPALDWVGQRDKWMGIALIHDGCAFTETPMRVNQSYAQGCSQWTYTVLAWLGQHPEITTVVISGYDWRRYNGSAIGGFHAVWNAIPATVKRIVIIRDAPHTMRWTFDCVNKAISHHWNAGLRCAGPRKKTLRYDAETAAATHSAPRRVSNLHFTQFFCDGRRCFPVVGGVLVYHDFDHLTEAYAVTLGPYVRRELDALK